MKRIAKIQNNEIITVFLVKDDYICGIGEIEESDAISQSIPYKTASPSFEDRMSSGYIVMPENFILGLLDSDRNAFSQMLSLVKEALDLGLISNDTPQTIKDINGETHTITTLRFRQIMVGYGMYFKSLWDNK